MLTPSPYAPPLATAIVLVEPSPIQGARTQQEPVDLNPFPIWIAFLLPVAVLVYWLGFHRVQKTIRGRRLEPKGRRIDGDDEVDPEFAAVVARAQRRNVITPIAEARAVPVMVRGTIVNANGNLGGPPGGECVWRNRAQGRRGTAVASELIIIADDTGRAMIENLERAQVIAPAETLTQHRESAGLYMGDVIEVIGTFNPDRIGEDPDPTKLVYGTLGGDGRLHVRVSQRPSEEPEADTETGAEESDAPESPTAQE